MLIFFVLLIIVFSVVVLLSLFAPEKLPWHRPHLILDKSEMEVVKGAPVVHRPIVMEGLAEPESDLQDNTARLESILMDKNKTIDKLQKELMAEKKHRDEFEKLKTMLDEEIKRLRSQNKELKTCLPVGGLQKTQIGETNA